MKPGPFDELLEWMPLFDISNLLLFTINLIQEMWFTTYVPNFMQKGALLELITSKSFQNY